MSLPYPARAGVVDAIVHNPLWLPGHRPVFQTHTIKGGLTLPPGAVLGRDSTNGKLTLCTFAGANGTNKPYAVTAEALSTYDRDGTTALDMTAAVAVHGYFNSTALYIDPSFTGGFDDLEPLLRAIGIFGRAPGYSG